jgi:hypothetical protein
MLKNENDFDNLTKFIAFVQTALHDENVEIDWRIRQEMAEALQWATEEITAWKLRNLN